MHYTKHQAAVLKVIRELIEKGAIEIKVAKNVFGFGPIIVRANENKGR